MHQPDPLDQPAKRIWNSGPYDVVARAIAEQLRQIAGAAPEVESLWVRAVRRDVGSFITEVEREWWLVIDVGSVIVVRLRDEDGTRLGSRDDLELVYDRDNPAFPLAASAPATSQGTQNTQDSREAQDTAETQDEEEA